MLHQHLMLWGQSAKKLKIGTVVNSYFLPLMKYTTESTLTPEERFKDAVLYFILDVSILGFLVSVCVGLEGRRGVTTTLSVINHNFKVYCWSHAKSRRYCIYCPPKKRSRCADTPMGHIRHKI